MTAADAFRQAVGHHRAGRLREALDSCREALAVDPQHSGALGLGGATALQLADYRQGMELLTVAAGLAPDAFDIHFNLGFACYAAGHLDEAVSAYQRALTLRPDFAQIHVNLGTVHRAAGRMADAAAACRRALDMEPDHIEALNNLGSVLEATGHLDDAIKVFDQARALRPDTAGLHYNFGRVALRAGRIDDAIEAFRLAVETEPGFMEARNNLGNALRMAGETDAAVETLKSALGVDPDHAETHNNLGGLLREAGRIEESLVHLRRAIEIRPDYGAAHNNLGAVLHEFGELDEAKDAFARALEADPDFTDSYGNLLFVANYHPDLAAEEIFAEYKRWDALLARPLAPAAISHANRRDPEKRLRVGYVSPDFRAHACLLFFEPLLVNHDRTAVETVAYADVPRPDSATERLMGLFGTWRDTVGMTDAELADTIRNDGIDILVELAGHTRGNRLLAFARKPSPIQVSWLGYGYTSGLSTMDYFLADADFVPEGAENLFSETVWRLPRSTFVFRPPPTAPDVGPLPAASNGFVTFGYFSRPVRVNHRVIKAWAGILQGVPGSRLLLNNVPFLDPAMRDSVLGRFAQHGVGEDRLVLMNESPPWPTYNAIDIALDPFPHNAGTTTFEALWMGVPVLTLAARPSVGRLGTTILNRLELNEWVAHSEEDYVERARRLAYDTEGLGRLRASLRPRMEASPLRDEAGFARDVEEAFREMWRRWCASAPDSGEHGAA